MEIYKPIYLEDMKGKEIEVKLSPSDMLMYSWELNHWRNKFEGDQCVQVFYIIMIHHYIILLEK